MRQTLCIWLLIGSLCPAQSPPAYSRDDRLETRFGQAEVVGSWLRGEVYYIDQSAGALPKFEKLKPAGTIYTNCLNVPYHFFSEGFVGVGGHRLEWFAIDYTGRFSIAKPGKYRFQLTSDDGAKLYIDEHAVVKNDGLHTPIRSGGAINLADGIHQIRLSYFQGPGAVALILTVAGPGDTDFRPFNTDEFKAPPIDPDTSRTRLRDVIK